MNAGSGHCGRSDTGRLVRAQFAQRHVLFLHLDGAQNLSRYNNRNDQHAVISTLKSMMQSPQWPVGLILSGMPDLLDLVNTDAQLARRLKPVEHRPLTTSVDGGMIVAAIPQYAAAANIMADDALFKPRFVRRLVHAADHCFGILAEMICEAIGVALIAGETVISVASFAACFARRSGCPDGLNPFIVEDFLAIDARKLLQPEPGPEDRGRSR